MLPHSLIVITGANRGFGRAVALALAEQAEHRTTLVLAGRNQGELERVQQQVVGKYVNVNVHIIANISLETARDAQETVLEKLQQLVNVRNTVHRCPGLNCNIPIFLCGGSANYTSFNACNSHQ